MIKLLVLDFDGVFTDGKVFFDDKGTIIKYYNVKDGYGIKLLHKTGVNIGVISGYKENNSQLEILKHLQIKYISLGNNNKLDILMNWCNELNLTLDKVAFMGDDLNDIEILKKVRLSGCPKDAHIECLNLSSFISTRTGGDGCVRELCEYIINLNNL